VGSPFAAYTTSITVAWAAGTNPLNVTKYEVELSTTATFDGIDDVLLSTYGVTSIFDNLQPGTTYHAQVKALNHSEISTSYLYMGSTATASSQVPLNVHATTATLTSVTVAWDAPTPAGDSYTLQFSTFANFSLILASSNTVLTTATISGLSINTTYYARANSIVSGSSSGWTAYITTATLAQTPATVASTWTIVGISSLTVNWSGVSNPASVTAYRVEISSVAGLASNVLSSTTYNTNAIFTNLFAETVYYGRVLAINHSGVETNYFTLGSTLTYIPNAPTNRNALVR
jgi:hypothetical protein